MQKEENRAVRGQPCSSTSHCDVTLTAFCTKESHISLPARSINMYKYKHKRVYQRISASQINTSLKRRSPVTLVPLLLTCLAVCGQWVRGGTKGFLLFLTSVQGDIFHLLPGGVDDSTSLPVYILTLGCIRFSLCIFPPFSTTRIRPRHPGFSFTLHSSSPCPNSSSLPFLGLSRC